MSEEELQISGQTKNIFEKNVESLISGEYNDLIEAKRKPKYLRLVEH
jgi:hypothetical protein